MIVKYTGKYRARIRKLLSPSDYYVFEKNYFDKFLYVQKGEIYGWIVLENTHKRLSIDWIFILEKHRSKGLGKKLIDHAKKICRKSKLRGITINTGRKNVKAQKFYIREGFEKVGKVKKLFDFDKEHIFFWFEAKK